MSKLIWDNWTVDKMHIQTFEALTWCGAYIHTLIGREIAMPYRSAVTFTKDTDTPICEKCLKNRQKKMDSLKSEKAKESWEY